MRVNRYSIRADVLNIQRIKRSIAFHGKPAVAEFEALLTHLAVKTRMSASTQNPAESAILLSYLGMLPRTWRVRAAFGLT